MLEECIGFGGMGTVYKALDLRKLEASDRKPYIAIKVLNVQFRGHPKSLIALQREARKAQALAHPNIVSVYDFDRDGPMVYLTMEYLTGKPLSQVLRAPGFAGMPYRRSDAHRRPAWAMRWRTRTSAASSTATSSPATCSSPTPASSRSSTSASRACSRKPRKTSTSPCSIRAAWAR